MNHSHELVDDGKHFIIDPQTREIKHEGQVYMVRGDHNSSVFTFEIPRYIDGHDMSASSEVVINFTNIGTNGTDKNIGAFVCKDVSLAEGESDIVTFSWSASIDATKYAGIVDVSVEFICKDDSGEIIYTWNTDILKDAVFILDSLKNYDEILDQYVDVIADKDSLIESQDAAIEEACNLLDELNGEVI